MRLIRIHTLSGKKYYTREIIPDFEQISFQDRGKDLVNDIVLQWIDIALIDSIDHGIDKILKDDPDCLKL